MKAAPGISPELRDRLEEIRRDPERLVGSIFATITEVEACFTQIPPAMRLDVMGSVRLFVSIWLGCVIEERLPTSAELDEAAAIGKRRLHQAIPLKSMLRSFSIGTQELLKSALNIAREHEHLRDEVLFTAAPLILEHIDTMSQAMALGYLNEQFEGARWRDAMRYELCSIVFGASADEASFRRAALALGLDPMGPYVAAAFDVELTSPYLSGIESELDRLTLDVTRYLKVQPSDVVRVMRHGRLVIWFPCALGDALTFTDQRLSQGLALAVRLMPMIRRVGVGLMNNGPSGWATSAEEAIRALNTGAFNSAKSKVHLYTDIVIFESVRSAGAAQRYLEGLVERLVHEDELIPTLEAYFSNMQRHKQTAAALDIHTNTLNYRLGRVEDLLGIKLDDLDQASKLNIALTLRRAGLAISAVNVGKESPKVS
ncbi:PucR family transcriptional regulator [Roseateles cellulosilyticus]|uniref:Helix-turn-helix domain-containing protein n=1 Tax=Pelomonas cellulosilytica TaxID=2906762 RepID=A0ABS8XYU3_9BURK|nr:helix-turn-helix domain-containing protein [Pelomonas sp. P8]MCE4556835.1 helix-turn-helix domain-containing protein [Pelomonas sp. P8]